LVPDIGKLCIAGEVEVSIDNVGFPLVNSKYPLRYTVLSSCDSLAVFNFAYNLSLYGNFEP